MLPALRPAEKYLGSWLWFIPYFLVCMAVVWHLRSSRDSGLKKFLQSKVFIFGTVAIVALISTVFYPFADALKLEMQGQDQDDCTILGVTALLAGENPVATPTYFGNPCSNLLGAIVPHAPFVITNLMGLAGPAFFALTVAFMYRKNMDRLQIGTFVAVIAGTPASLELMVNGSDFVFIGFMSLIAVFLVNSSKNAEKLKNSIFYPLALLVGLIASTRINMPIFAVPFGIILLQRRNRWVWFTLIVSAIVLVPNVLVYLSNPEGFAPLHLISKGQSLVPGVFYVLMFLVTAVAVLAAFIMRSRFHWDDLSTVLLVVAPHLIFLSFGDLVFNRQFDIFWWEGANYLYLLTPMLAWFSISRLVRTRDKHE